MCRESDGYGGEDVNVTGEWRAMIPLWEEEARDTGCLSVKRVELFVALINIRALNDPCTMHDVPVTSKPP